MTCSRWIRVCVDTFDHPSLKGEFDRRSAWLWLIANAAWKDHKTRTRGGIVEIKRGQVLAGLKFLADTWGWSIKRVRTFLGELEAEGMIERGQTKNQYAAVVTICNYDKYQTPTETEATDGASEGQARGKRGASEGQHSTKDTRDINNIPSVATVVPLAARAEAAAAKPKIDFRDLHRRLIEAGGDALNRTSASLETVSDVIGWIETGADLDQDILPVIRAKAARARPQSIRSWQYFATAVAEAVEKRKRGLPTVAEPEVQPVFRVSPETVRYAKPALDDSWLHELRAKNEQRRAATC